MRCLFSFYLKYAVASQIKGPQGDKGLLERTVEVMPFL